MVSLLSPTVALIVDDSVDISVFLTSNDDEEKEAEKNKDKEVFFIDYSINEIDFTSLKVENNLVYFFKKYTKPHLNIISPPPDFLI